jgi:uncharacterized membrane protein YcaP (DUF421 family)
MDNFDSLWGSGEHLDWIQMSIRAGAMFMITLILIRLGGMRMVRQRSAFDTIIMITMGSVLARGVVGASSFTATIAAAICMIIINRVIAWLVERYKPVNLLVKGKPTLLYSEGHIHWHNMRMASISMSDLMESLRLETKRESFDEVERAVLEANGRISFVMQSRG